MRGWHALVWIGQRCRQRWRWWWHRRRIAQLQDHVQRALQAGAIQEAVGMLEEQQGLYDWPFQVEALLFKRSCRPDSLSLTLVLLERLRRQVFWSRFLEIPELHVKVLPAKLLPADRAGVFPVRWWHRLYWQSVRRLLRLPVDGLAACKGSLKRLR